MFFTAATAELSNGPSPLDLAIDTEAIVPSGNIPICNVTDMLLRADGGRLQPSEALTRIRSSKLPAVSSPRSSAKACCRSGLSDSKSASACAFLSSADLRAASCAFLAESAAAFSSRPRQPFSWRLLRPFSWPHQQPVSWLPRQQLSWRLLRLFLRLFFGLFLGYISLLLIFKLFGVGDLLGFIGFLGIVSLFGLLCFLFGLFGFVGSFLLFGFLSGLFFLLFRSFYSFLFLLLDLFCSSCSTSVCRAAVFFASPAIFWLVWVVAWLLDLS